MAYKSQGWLGVLFIAVIVVLGGFVLVRASWCLWARSRVPRTSLGDLQIDLFLAIMLGHFEGLDDKALPADPVTTSNDHDAGDDRRSAGSRRPAPEDGASSAGRSASHPPSQRPAHDGSMRRASIDAVRQTDTFARSRRSIFNDARSTGTSGTRKRPRRSSIAKTVDNAMLAGNAVREAARRRMRALRDVIAALSDSNVVSCMLAERARVLTAYAARRGMARGGSRPRRGSFAGGAPTASDSAAGAALGVSKGKLHATVVEESSPRLAPGDLQSSKDVRAVAPTPGAPLPFATSSARAIPQRPAPLVAAEVFATASRRLSTAPLLAPPSAEDDDEARQDAHSDLSQLSSLHTDELSSAGRGTVGSDIASTVGSDDDDEDDDDDGTGKAPQEEDVFRDWQAMLNAASSGSRARDSGWCWRTAQAAGTLLLHTFCCCLLRRGKAVKGPIDKSFCLFSERHPLRRICIALVNNPRFDSLTLFVIFASSISLAIDSPLLDPESPVARVLGELDLVFVIFFTFEMAVRLIALGVVLSPGAYMRSGWNILDGGIVAVSWLSYATDGNAQFRSLRALRALRALRPLRVVRRLPGLRLVVHALFRAFQPILEVILVCSILFLIFAIVLTGLFKGSLSTCYGNTVYVNPSFMYPASRSGMYSLPCRSTHPAPSLLILVFLVQNIWIMDRPQLALLFDPVPYNTLTAEQRNWTLLGPCGTSQSSSPCGEGFGYGWGTPDDETPTSKVVCLWFGGTWGPVWPQSFDNVILVRLVGYGSCSYLDSHRLFPKTVFYHLA